MACGAPVHWSKYTTVVGMGNKTSYKQLKVASKKLPEKLATTCQLIRRKIVDQLCNIIVKNRLPKIPGPLNTILEVSGLLISLRIKM